jgi:hypothetical protein
LVQEDLSKNHIPASFFNFKSAKEFLLGAKFLFEINIEKNGETGAKNQGHTMGENGVKFI